MNPLILWCFGWKKKREVYSFRGWPVSTAILWKDPLGEFGWLTKSHAIKVCEERITS